MKKKLISLLLVTAVLVSACGAEEETSEDDVEIEESEVPKSDEASDDDGEGIFSMITEGNETETTAVADEESATETADAETATASTDYAEGTTETATASTYDPVYVDADVTIEQSDVNSNLWVITNTSTTTYHMCVNNDNVQGGDHVSDYCFLPGEVIYYFASADDGEVTEDSFLFTEDDICEAGENYDAQFSVVTISYDEMKFEDDGYGNALYHLEDVWDIHKSKISYQEEKYIEDAYVVYFRLLDADGNVICEPEDYDDIINVAGVDCLCLYDVIAGDPSILSSWDHAEFYVRQF
ncbi:MAG: hypothetical protein K6G87_06565 [Butyrivibrio sp.]|uniref:hypothetical protein n=1 Tax=Butyrivibrio sp. TaxID=28121 RepID=UPI0025CBCCFD|nr:hypothetical protein [Butyrivibrio sp.]MCR5770881.1 hypothetical protein [Butyrivibrio sp.]